MRVLYYLEPVAELGNPLFRLATVRNHLEHEMRALRANPVMDVEIVLVCAERILRAARKEGLLEDIRAVTLSVGELDDIYPDYLSASLHWYEGTYDASALERAMALYARKLRGFTPDVIVCYESNAPFLAQLYPDALFLHDTLGLFSRPPYPVMSALDPFGIGKHSYLARFGKNLRGTRLSAREIARLQTLKAAYRGAQVSGSPVQREQVRGNFERVVLLPLQVSRYFMYDGNCPEILRGHDQLALVEYVLRQVPRDVGVYATLHRVEAKSLPDGRLLALKNRFPNLLIDPRITALPWSSQHVLPHVDGVVAVASSVGLQALCWDLPVVALGRSHLTGIASADELSALPGLLERGRTTDLDPVLYHLLSRYYPLLSTYHHDGAWFVRFLERCLAWHRAGRSGSPFEEIDEPDVLFEALLRGLRRGQYAAEIDAVAVRRAATRPVENTAFDTELAQADLVSFDIFDTLVTRPLLEPRAMFSIIAGDATRILHQHAAQFWGAGAFSEIRERAARLASQDAYDRGSEEYDLDAVYAHVVALVGVPIASRSDAIAALRQLEEAAEFDLARPVPGGRAHFERAKELRKRVVLISDTYLDRALVMRILRQAGIQGYDALYVSSEVGVCKKSGALFRHVRTSEGSPQRWLHAGDHVVSDQTVPDALGIHTCRLPNISERYLADVHVLRAWEGVPIAATAARSIVHGVVSRKFFAECAARVGAFGGSGYRLGYEAGGPVLLGFVQWLWERARRDGITDLYFLARDGLLPKECAEILFAGQAGPRCHYLFASRRLLTVPSLRSQADIVEALPGRSSSPQTLGELLLHRFGVAPHTVDPLCFRRHGYIGQADLVDPRESGQRQRLEAFCFEIADVILAQAERERGDVAAYLEQAGLFDATRRIAVVDIGHHASLQHALSILTGRPDIRGYYFATFAEAQPRYALGLEMASYLLQFEDSETSVHPYCRAIGMFEFLFLPPTRSIVGLDRQGNAFVPRFADGDESLRMQRAEELHGGVRDFMVDVYAATRGAPEIAQLGRSDAVRTYLSFVSRPSYADAKLLQGVAFIDAFGGFGKRYLVPATPPASKKRRAVNAYLAASWWKPGARVLARLPAFRVPSLDWSGPKWQRKLRKFRRDPSRFVSDMPISRRVKRVLSDITARLAGKRRRSSE